MAAGLQALRNHGVNSMCLQPQPLFQRGRRRDDFCAPAAHLREQLGRRQAEVETHDRRLELRQQLHSGPAERFPPTCHSNFPWVYRQFLVIREQAGAPGGFACFVRHRWRVAEEVDVKGGTRRGLPDPLQLTAHGCGAEQGAGQGAKASGRRDGQRQLRVLHARHGRLHYGQARAKQRSDATGCAHDPWPQ